MMHSADTRFADFDQEEYGFDDYGESVLQAKHLADV